MAPVLTQACPCPQGGAVSDSGDSQGLNPALLPEDPSQDSPSILPPSTLGAHSGPGTLPPWPAP